MQISLRGWIVVGAFSALMAVFAFATANFASAQQNARPSGGSLTAESIGPLLSAVGLKPTRQEDRYDFAFKSTFDENEWELSMSTVLSEDGKSLWVTAWLSELPQSTPDIPRMALLRLLADNDKLGNGKFFAYVAENRHFVLQRIIPNQNISPASFREVLHDLAESVVDTYPHWTVENWIQPAATPETAGAPTPVRSAINDSKFKLPVRK